MRHEADDSALEGECGLCDPASPQVPREYAEEIRPPTDEKTSEWITALAAAGFDYLLSQDEIGWTIRVTREAAAPAREEIAAYEADNRDWPPPPRLPAAAPQLPYFTWSAAWVCGFLAAFYVWLGPYRSGDVLLEAGAADTERILAGEWWRLITSLTLHSGVVHLLGNMACLFFLGQAVCRIMGGGLGWALILGAGVAGNAGVAWMLRSDHVSVGASTSGFGALGILAAYQALQKLRQTGGAPGIWDRTWIPVGAGLALLALLGTGPRSDLAAHAFGLLFGMILSVPFALYGSRWLPSWIQRVLQLACLCAVMGAWRVACIRGT